MFWLFNATVKAYQKQFLSLFFSFIVAFLFSNHSWKSIYDPPLFRSIVLQPFEGCNTINQCYQEQTCFLSFFLLNLFDNFVKEIEKAFR